ncbi:small conductance mechanosensitive channel [Laceyella sediminis]|uniref:Small conductance mechanosensitive channel n=2 Tax=Laceyella TaxID=292635 RepID=A0ABX5EN35_9BACL|nr:mechanosensitive ion channel family protein [Laceyella sediminis]PRZ13863.1 small conductance mechanosensitive channel [Laceyella sediminis]
MFTTFSANGLFSGVFGSIIKAMIILVLAGIAYAVLKQVIIRATVSSKRLNKGTQQRIQTIQSLLVNIASYVIFFIALVSILPEFGINISALLASAGVLGLAIGFGAKDLVSDIVTGFFMLMEDQVHVGEEITVNGFSGTVEHVGLRTLKLRSANGDLHFLLNRDIKSLTNHSRGVMQATVDLPLPADIDVEKMIAYLEETCRKMKHHIPAIVEGPTVLGVENINTTETVIRVYARTENGEQARVEREMRKELKMALDQSEFAKVSAT